MRDNNIFKMPEKNGAIAEMAPNQVFKDILKIQQEVDQARINYFVNPVNKKNSILDIFNIFT